MRPLLHALALAAAATFSALTSAEVTVSVDGAVSRAGEQRLQEGARLFDAIKAAGVVPEAYHLGAAWLHRKDIPAQRELKFGLIFDLNVIGKDAERAENAGLVVLVDRLRDGLNSMPVTGRRANTLDPIRLELDRGSNRHVDDGDRLLYPVRPKTVLVTGAVHADCELPHVGLRPAIEYLAACPRHPAADTDWSYVVQPDGQVFRQGVALWNRESGSPLAPGARLYVPLRATMTKEAAQAFNDAFAAFLATQPLPLAGHVK